MESMKPVKRVLMLCADNMEDYEAIVPFQALKAYGVEVDAVCPSKNAGDACRTVKYKAYNDQVLAPNAPAWLRTYSEIQGHNFTLNATFADINVSMYDGLVIPGARGPEYLATYESVRKIVCEFYLNEKPIAAMCHAILLLAMSNQEIIRGRKCTGFPTMKPVALAAGALWVKPNTRDIVVVDDKLISASLYAGHHEFIGKFLEALGGRVCGPEKRILMLCGDFMEEYDGIVPFQTLQVVGCHVDAVCLGKKQGEVCPTSVQEYEHESNYTEIPGNPFILTADFHYVDPHSYDGLIISGGRAAEYYALDEKVLSLVKSFMVADKPVAAIGYGQLILAAANVLKGKICTAHKCAKVNVMLAKAVWQEPEPVTRCYLDGNLVTGAWWQGHPELISQFMALLGIHVSFI